MKEVDKCVLEKNKFLDVNRCDSRRKCLSRFCNVISKLLKIR